MWKTSRTHSKKRFDENFVRSVRQLLEEITKNCTKILSSFWGKLQKNAVTF